MRYLKMAALITCIFLFENGTYCQVASTQDYHPVTPTAYQFLKYLDMPVSEYTGIPNISIPLYEFDVDGRKIPISLTYHSNGIKVSEDASWVGLGWDLSFGSIVQMINDYDDFDPQVGKTRPDYQYSPTPSHFPYICENTTPNPTTWPSNYSGNIPQFNLGFSICTGYWVPISGNYGQNVALFTGYQDSEPDILKASFLGYSVTFKLDWNTNQIVVLNRSGYTVTHLSDGTWEIIVPNGDQFFFQTKTTVSSSSASTQGGGTGACTSSNIWMLTRFVTTNKKEVDFNYTSTATVDCYPSYSEGWTNSVLTSTVLYVTNTLNDKEGNLYPYALTGSNYNENFSFSKENHVYLQSITTPDGSVTFSTSNTDDVLGGKKLDSISIYSPSSWTRSFVFNYDHFTSVAPLNSNNSISFGSSFDNEFAPFEGLRLKLNSIQLNDGSSYTFNYNSTPLPWKNSFAQDYWGYYNGNSNNQHLVPNPIQFSSTSNSNVDPTATFTPACFTALGDNGDNHSANSQFTQAGILNEIVYPTGGKVDFTYELNQFNNYWVPDYTSNNNTISSGNGLRIKYVTFFQADGTQSKNTYYTYSGGKDMVTHSMFKDYQMPIFEMSVGGGVYAVHMYHTYCVNANGGYSASMLGSINGVGYGLVTKQELDANNNNNGSEQTSFVNNVDMQEGSTAFYQTDLTSPSIKNILYPDNGSLLASTIYDKNNMLVKSINNNYFNNILSPLDYGVKKFGYAPLICMTTETIYPGSPGYDPTLQQFTGYSVSPQSILCYYPIQDCQSLLQSTIETNYFDNGSVTKTTSYTYDAFNNVSTVITNNSLGETDNTYLKYTSDFAVHSDNTNTYTNMVAQNMLSQLIEKRNIKEKQGTIYYTGQINTYHTYSNSISNNVYLPYANYIIQNNNPLNSVSQATYSGTPYSGDLNMDPKYAMKRSYAYNANWDVCSYTDQGNATAAFLYDPYFNEVAEIQNGKTAGNSANVDAAYTSFEYQNSSEPGIAIDIYNMYWNIQNVNNANIISAPGQAPTGNSYYHISTSSLSIPNVTTSNLMLSYWSDNGACYIPAMSTVKTGNTINIGGHSWTYYEHSNYNGSSTLTITGSSATNIDELRVFHSNTLMKTYTYNTLIGMTSSCNENNVITHYEYDSNNRLSLIRDANGNVVKKYEYGIQTNE